MLSGVYSVYVIVHIDKFHDGRLIGGDFPRNLAATLNDRQNDQKRQSQPDCYLNSL
jgi:hypothetical protein